MNKKISTYTGLITGILILAYILIIGSFQLAPNSPLLLIRFVILLAGIVVSCYLLYRYYTDIKPVETFIHCIKTAITALVIVLIGNTLLFFIMPGNKSMSEYTLQLMILIFTYSFSGLLSSVLTSLLFNIFTKK